MPAKGKGKNPKAVAARNAKEETAKKKKAVESKAQDDAAWADDGQDKKSKLKAAKEAKARADAEKKRQKKELEAEDKKNMAGKPKGTVAAVKVTKAQIAAKRAKADRQREEDEKAEALKKNRIVKQMDLTPNMNKPTAGNDAEDFDDQWLSNVDAAVADMKLSGAKEKHPEKKMKAAYKGYCAENMPLIKEEFPHLKLSQYKQKLWDSWQKSPDNPLFMMKIK